MAALSRPSLRSSARKNHVPESPATDIALPSRSTRRMGKRTRDSSVDNESNASSKRLKNSPQERLRGKGQPVKNEPIRIPIRDKKPVKPSQKSAVTHGVTSRHPPAASQYSVPDTSIDNVRNPPPNTTSNGVNSASLQTAETLKQVEKRSLRSHDGGSRSKSELALYFPNYDELVSIEPKAADTLTPDTILHITDDPGTSKTTSPPQNRLSSSLPASKGKKSVTNGSAQTVEWSEATFTNLTDATRIDLSKLKIVGRVIKKEPLDDDFYLKIHRRLERQEKQLRNIEKERAMHEKVQLERLLDGLKGHDWLRVMGISGITDGEKKAYEPRRDHLIGEVRILLEKFRLWKEEEKRRKVEREEVNGDDEDDEEVEEEDEEGEDEGEEEEEVEEDAEEEVEDEEQSEEPAESEGGVSDGDPPEYSDIDASALQLRLEAARASQPYIPSPSAVSSRPRLPKAQPITYTQQSITSFFSKPYQRQAAIGNHRRGRSRYAFGHPLPEPEEQPFELPGDVLTEEALAASERGRRAAKRRRDAGPH